MKNVAALGLVAHKASLAAALTRLWDLGMVDVALMVTFIFLKMSFYTYSYTASAE